MFNQLQYVGRKVWHLFYPYTALNELDKKLLQYLPTGPGFFIEAGANDGIRQSNTYFLEKRRSWTGLLVEPVPRLAKRCAKNRSRSSVEQVVLVAPERTGTSMDMVDLDLMSLVSEHNLGLIDKDAHIRTGESVRGVTSSNLSVLGITLSELLEKHGNPKIDLLSLDVEGFELDVLAGLDLTRHAPIFILVETRVIDQVSRVLSSHYEMVDALSHHDYLFKMKESQEKL